MLALLGGIRATIFAAVALGLGVYALVLQSRLAESRQQVSAEAASAAVYKTNAAGWQIDALQARIDLSKCQAQWATAQQSLSEQREAAARLGELKDAEIAEWKERWDARPAGCQAALQALDAACPHLRNY